MTDKVEYESESESTAFSAVGEKFKRSPFFAASIIGFTAVCGVGAYKYKHRGNMPAALYLVQLRVVAQGTALGLLTLGLIYQMFKQHVLKQPSWVYP